MRERASDRRGVNRGLFSALFDDPDYQRLPAEARLVLLTARLSKQAGPGVIFRYYPEVLARQTGLSLRRVALAVQALIQDRWVEVEDGVLWVRNGLRWDPNIRLSDPKHRLGVARSLLDLPRADIVLRFCDYYEIARPFGGSSEGLGSLSRLRSKEKGVRSPYSPHASEATDPAAPDATNRSPAAAPQATREAQGPAAETPGPVPQATTARKARRPEEPSRAFEAFYAAYPRHEAKQPAWTAWCKLGLANGLIEQIMAAVPIHAERWRRLGTPADKIPLPATWLNGQRWLDRFDGPAPADPHANYPVYRP